MARWEPHVQQRLELAALDLYTRQGYESTTVGQIAAHAGVTSRTYFRYFPDKREVLFGGAAGLRDRIARSLHEAPAGMAPLEATLHAMSACEDLYDARRHEYLRRREAVVDSSADLQEREAHKLASIAEVVADELGQRGSDPNSARLVANLALAVFQQAARYWMEDPQVPYGVQLYRATAQAQTILRAQTSGDQAPVL